MGMGWRTVKQICASVRCPNEKEKWIEIELFLLFHLCRLIASRTKSTETVQLFVHALRCTCSDSNFHRTVESFRYIYKWCATHNPWAIEIAFVLCKLTHAYRSVVRWDRATLELKMAQQKNKSEKRSRKNKILACVSETRFSLKLGLVN